MLVWLLPQKGCWCLIWPLGSSGRLPGQATQEPKGNGTNCRISCQDLSSQLMHLMYPDPMALELAISTWLSRAAPLQDTHVLGASQAHQTPPAPKCSREPLPLGGLTVSWLSSQSKSQEMGVARHLCRC